MMKMYLLIAPLALTLGCITIPAGAAPPPTLSSDANAYPLKPASTYTSAGLNEMGKGSHRLEIDISNGFHQASPMTLAVEVTPDGAAPFIAAAPVTVYSYIGADIAKSDQIVIHGEFGTKMPNIRLIPIAPGGLNEAFVNAVSYDYSPMVSNSCNDSRGGCSVNLPTVFNSLGAAIQFGPAVYVTPPPPPVPPATQTVISGASCNGVATTDGTLAQVITQCASGTLSLPSGIIIGTSTVPAPITIAGAGMGKTIIEGAGLRPTYDKGGLVPLVPGVTVQDLTIRNFEIPAALGANAAGIRDNGDGVGFSLVRVELAHNQNGTLTYNSTIAIADSDLHDNGEHGGDSGRVHNAYIGGAGSTSLTVRGTKSYAPHGAHAFKTRSPTSNFTNDTFTAGGDGAALDVPDGGSVHVDNLTLIQPGTGGTHNILTLALESNRNAAAGMSLDGVLHIEDPAGVAIISCSNGYALKLAPGSTYKGPKDRPDVRGCTINGSFRKVN